MPNDQINISAWAGWYDFLLAPIAAWILWLVIKRVKQNRKDKDKYK
jgi:hypothetical protein